MTHNALKFYSVKNSFVFLYAYMSNQLKFKNHSNFEDTKFINRDKVKLTDLLDRLNQEKKKERNSNIALSVAAVSAVTVFGIILSL